MRFVAERPLRMLVRRVVVALRMRLSSVSGFAVWSSPLTSFGPCEIEGADIWQSREVVEFAICDLSTLAIYERHCLFRLPF